MMRLFLVISLLFISLLGFSQGDINAVKASILKLDNALINQDSASLALLLDGKLSYGHSNGWVQDKSDMWTDFKKGTVSYGKISNSEIAVTSVSKDLITVRMTSRILGTHDKKEFDLNLHVLQVWKKDKKGWQLVARQSTKI